MNNIDKYNSIFRNILLLEEKEVKNACINTVAQWDSLEHFHLITELEKQFGFRFESGEIADFVSYESGMNILKKHGVNF